MNLKKIIAATMAATILTSLAGCAKNENSNESNSASQPNVNSNNDIPAGNNIFADKEALIKSRVTSADATAMSIKAALDDFMFKANMDGFGIKESSDIVEMFNFTVNDGVWECSHANNPDHFEKGGGTKIEWGHGGEESRCKTGEDRENITSGEKYLCSHLADRLPSIKSASIVVWFVGGKNCTYVVYTTNKSTPLIDSEFPQPTNGIPPETFEWNGKNAGVTPDGTVIGTAPNVGLK